MKPSLLATGIACALCAVPPQHTQAPDAPVRAFAALDGSWEGTFVGWDVEGRESSIA